MQLLQSARSSASVLVAIMLVAGGAPCATCAADTLHVPSEYATIQAAVDAAVDGDEVVVADGTYAGPGNTNVTIAKGITVRSAKGAASCVIDGEFENRGFLTSVDVGPATIIQGFTIRRGFSIWTGAGIAASGSPTIRDCVFTENIAVSAVGGGGIGMDAPGAAPTIEGCVFANNHANFYGGGILATNAAHPTLIECVFIGNFAGVGGGVAIRQNSSAHIERCAFVGNYSTGIYIQSTVPSTIVNCLFSGNAGSGSGVSSSTSTTAISSSTFTGNVAGAIGGSATIVNSILEGSVSPVGEPLPDQVHGSLAGITIDSSAVVGGWTGSGSNNIDADPLFATLASGVWTMAPVYDATTNSTVYTDATATFVPGAMVGRTFNPDTSQARQLWIVANTGTTLRVPGNFSSGGEPVVLWNLSVEAGDAYVVLNPRPASDSPVIDAGDNSAVPRGLVVDLDGNPRMVDVPEAPDTGIGRPPLIDMGAFERQVEPVVDPIPGDLNRDGTVDGADLGLLLAAWGEPGGDLNDDGTTDGADLGVLLAAWTG